MTTQNHAAQAELQDINAIIAKHFGDDTAGAVRAQITVNEVLPKLRYPAPAMQEAVLTDAEIREIQGTHLVTISSRDALIASVIVAGRAIEAAVLSKLRAPVADERAAFEWWASDEGEYPASVERDGNGNYKLAQIQAHWDAWQARAALASAPVAGEQIIAWDVQDTGLGRRYTTYNPKIAEDLMNLGEDVRPLVYASALPPANAAPRASAPVAGEARPTDRQEALRITELPDVDEALATFCSDGTQDNAVGLVLAILSAASQASDAVRANERESSPTAGMNLGQRIAHVGGRTNAQGYIEFGSEMAVDALIRHVLRDLKSTPAPTAADGGDDVALPPLPHPTAHRRHAMFAGSQMTSYAKEAVLADRQQRAGDDMLTIAYLAGAQAEKERAALADRQQRADDSLDAEDAKCWRWMWNHAENVSFSYSLNSTTRTMVSGLHGGSLKDVVVAARTDHRRCSGTATEGFLENIRSLADGLMGGNPSRPEMREAARLLQNFYLEQRGDLAEALRPFAGVEEADLVGTVFQGKDDDEVMLYFHRTGKSITLGDFRRARAALTAPSATQIEQGERDE